MIDERYLAEFERWIPGPDAVRADRRRELEAHLQDAQEMGRADRAIARLGDPHEAARAFATPSAYVAASLPKRLVAAAIDYGILVGLIQIPHVVALVAAVTLFVVGLTLMEWRIGQTVGKMLVGTRVVAEDGTVPTFKQIILRRLTLNFSGPLQLVDWGFLLVRSDRPQRGVERLAKTFVIDDRRTWPEGGSPGYAPAAIV